MCTVLYLPGKDQVCFASLRDESPKRLTASAPKIWGKHVLPFLAPKDEQAGGTWIGTNRLGTVIILLNGGFDNHEKSTHYAKSRGVIVTELLSSFNAIADWEIMNLLNIEPFTLVVYNNKELYKLVWDSRTKHVIQLNPENAYLLSSATLYSKEAKEKREATFQNWITTDPMISVDSVLDFFKSSNDPNNGFIINRQEAARTLSYSFIQLNKEKTVTMHYNNLENNSVTSITIELVNIGAEALKDIIK